VSSAAYPSVHSLANRSAHSTNGVFDIVSIKVQIDEGSLAKSDFVDVDAL